MAAKISLRTIVIGGVVAGLLIPMSIGTVYVIKAQSSRLYEEAGSIHARATNVLSLGVSKALWDLAPEAAIPLVDSIMEDSRIASASVFDGQGNAFHTKSLDDRRRGQMLILEKPVKNGEEEIGKVIVEFSLAEVEHQISNKMLEALTLSIAQALACIFILLILINRRLLKPIEVLKNQAERIAQKSLDQEFNWKSSDEIGDLGRSLESTRIALKDLFAEIESKNKSLAEMNDNLEKIVAERTATIQMILDHVKSGFLLIDRSMTVLDGYTKSCESLLDRRVLAGITLDEALRLAGPSAAYFKVCIDQVFEDFMPEEVTVGQIPGRFKIGAHTISIEGSTIRNQHGVIEKILFTIVDITMLERIEVENKSNRAIVRIMQNISAFHEFVKESNTRMLQAANALKTGQEAIVRRELHTLKGNTAAFGIDAISSLIHEIEDQSQISNESLETIEREFGRFLEQNYELFKLRLGETAEQLFTLTSAEIKQLRDILVDCLDSTLVDAVMGKWLSELKKVPVADIVGPIAGYVEKISAERNRKVKFIIDGASTRIDRDRYKDVLQNLIHLIRNAVDHGIELPEDRGGKPEQGTIALSITDHPQGLSIKISDDGRGLDRNKILAKAKAMGLLSDDQVKQMSDTEVYRLIFADGLSTADAVSTISGRGVGMRAVLDSIEAIGGQIAIESKLGVGSTFNIAIPHA